jgi:dipeptidyl-peptidase-4
MKFLNVRFLLLLAVCSFYIQISNAQFLCDNNLIWAKDGNSYFSISERSIQQTDIKSNTKTTFISRQQLTPEGSTSSLRPASFKLSDDNSKALIFTNTAKVWRYNTRGDYWVLDIDKKKINTTGKRKTVAIINVCQVFS